MQQGGGKVPGRLSTHEVKNLTFQFEKEGIGWLNL